jgi:hypothetical protein
MVRSETFPIRKVVVLGQEAMDVGRVGRSNPSPKTEYLIAHEVHEGRINDDFETRAASEVQAR